ncbi:hypothetical protein MMC07_003528 [Pseudocyphellaria aurata]|nr:hypothetical protein [Pseudocyphellaria aurata]
MPQKILDLQSWWDRVDAVLLGSVWIGDGKNTVEINFLKASQVQPDRLLQYATILANRTKSLQVKVRFENLILLALCDIPLFQGIPIQPMFEAMKKSFRSDQDRNMESFLKGALGPKKFTKELYMRGFACDRISLIIPWGRGLCPYSRLGNTYGESLDYYMRRLEKPQHRKKLPPWPEDVPMAQPYLIHQILKGPSTCVRICQELGYSEDSLLSTGPIIHSTSSTARNSDSSDWDSVDEDDPSLGQITKPGEENDID